MVDRRYLPLFDEFDDHSPGTLTWLQAWYASQCDGDWEHGFGISIDTLDNPGWSIRIDLPTGSARTHVGSELHRSEHDWITVRVVGHRFEAHCGPLNLGEAIHEFRLWIEGPPRLAELATDAP